MFSSKEYLDRKTGPYGIGRLSYLQSLVTEFQDTDDEEAKEQVLANLANFAYDPINYEFFKKLNVVDLFLVTEIDLEHNVSNKLSQSVTEIDLEHSIPEQLWSHQEVHMESFADPTDCLEENNEKFIEFSIGGICNCCLDKVIKQHIIESGGIELIIKCLSRPQENTVMSAVTTLMYLTTPQTKAAITKLPVVECMLRFSESSNKLLANLAQVFLQDYCSSEQIKEAKEVQKTIRNTFKNEET